MYKTFPVVIYFTDDVHTDGHIVLVRLRVNMWHQAATFWFSIATHSLE